MADGIDVRAWNCCVVLERTRAKDAGPEYPSKIEDEIALLARHGGKESIKALGRRYNGIHFECLLVSGISAQYTAGGKLRADRFKFLKQIVVYEKWPKPVESLRDGPFWNEDFYDDFFSKYVEPTLLKHLTKTAASPPHNPVSTAASPPHSGQIPPSPAANPPHSGQMQSISDNDSLLAHCSEPSTSVSDSAHVSAFHHADQIQSPPRKQADQGLAAVVEKVQNWLAANAKDTGTSPAVGRTKGANEVVIGVSPSGTKDARPRVTSADLLYSKAYPLRVSGLPSGVTSDVLTLEFEKYGRITYAMKGDYSNFGIVAYGTKEEALAARSQVSVADLWGTEAKVQPDWADDTEEDDEPGSKRRRQDDADNDLPKRNPVRFRVNPRQPPPKTGRFELPRSQLDESGRLRRPSAPQSGKWQQQQEHAPERANQYRPNHSTSRPNHPTTLYFPSVPDDLHPDDLSAKVAAFGAVDVRVVPRKLGMGTMAFVDFRDRDSAQRAIAALAGKEMFGMKEAVEGVHRPPSGDSPIFKLSVSTNLPDVRPRPNLTRDSSELDRLYQYLENSFPEYITPPPPPPKSQDVAFLSRSTQVFLDRITEHAVLRRSEGVRLFVESEFGFLAPSSTANNKKNAGFMKSLISSTPAKDVDVFFDHAKDDTAAFKNGMMAFGRVNDKISKLEREVGKATGEVGTQAGSLSLDTKGSLAGLLRKASKGFQLSEDALLRQSAYSSGEFNDECSMFIKGALSAQAALNHRLGILSDYELACKATQKRLQVLEKLKSSSTIQSTKVDAAMADLADAKRLENDTRDSLKRANDILKEEYKAYSERREADMVSFLARYVEKQIEVGQMQMRAWQGILPDL
ncbi:Vacuolar protein sorting-associated protein 17 [Borealophlyctis nickersoniae]|nr:Vacuolar protein sorting-associated protein 17 [Borealophlyctis nickersoniae]